MPGALSMDLRERVIAAYEGGGYTYKTVAKAFAVGEATVNRWLRLRRETGAVTPRAHRGGNPGKIRGEELARFRKLVERHRDWSAPELTRAWAKETGQEVHRSTVKRALRRLGFTHKKSPSARRRSASRR